MYDVSKLPAVRAMLEQAGQTEQNPDPAPGVEYVRAPQATGTPASTGRPPAIQGTTR